MGGAGELAPMSQKTLLDFESSGVECPTCGETGFDGKQGMKIHHAHAHGERIGLVELECFNCGDVFERPEWHATRDQNRDFCSKECEAASRPTGQDSHRWTGGDKWDYGVEWRRKREDTIERDGEECWLCGFPRAAHTLAYGQDINVHHVIPRNEGGTDELGNTITACKRCHWAME